MKHHILAAFLLLGLSLHTTTQAASLPDLAAGDYTMAVWIKTKLDGSILAKTKADGPWVHGGKTLFVRDGRVCFDIGWSGCVQGRQRVVDDKWHHVALVGAKPQRLYVDGKLDAQGKLDTLKDPKGSVLKVGLTSVNFPMGGIGFNGALDDLRVYDRALSGEEIRQLANAKPVDQGLVLHMPLENEAACNACDAPVMISGKQKFVPGRLGKGVQLAHSQKARGKSRGGQPDSLPALTKPGKLDTKAVLQAGTPFGFDKIVFVKRFTYSANHYYTEFINSKWLPGGNLCVLDLKTGAVTELVPELKDGVFGRFDMHFDANRIVFAWKCDAQQGYRLYEIEIDPVSGERRGELKQLTFPQENEEWLVKMYRARPHYHHGTDDMDPCYLPDGDICFISTRCQYGILCDGPDDFTTTVLYRLNPKSGKMTMLSNSSVSEASPAMLPDGRILYTRWEYFDKGAVSVKCLWAMKPDGFGSVEVYGNDISLPPTFLYGRPIPGKRNEYVMLGTPHCPQNGMGTVIRIDMSKDIRTRDPMTYMTPYVDIQAEPGFSFMSEEGEWVRDRSGTGPLFKDPYPLSGKLFLVSYKPEGPRWLDETAYALALLDENGAVGEIFRDDGISCWHPFPLKPRPTPPVLETPADPKLAAKNLARCVVTDIYHGMENTERGTIKYIRVLEQIPRPWATRRRWDGDVYDQQHAAITKDTHLGLRVQHGVVPVEADGSAQFLVPAKANISFQALDENFMSVQTERTFVNYMPGETRSCVGCHETPNEAVPQRSTLPLIALTRPPSIPGPQPGETRGKRPLDFHLDVQPVLDKHCVKCHGGDEPKAGLNLTGEPTAMFSVAYEQLIPERRRGKGRARDKYTLVGPTIGENHPKTGNVHYLPARSLGSHSSILVAMLASGKVKLSDPEDRKIAARLAKTHAELELSPQELLKITNWIDTNCQYYGMYWGRKNLKYKDHPNFRPRPTFERAASYTSAIPEDER